MSFETAFKKLASARSRYEELRIGGAPAAQLVDAHVELIELRAEMARARRVL